MPNDPTYAITYYVPAHLYYANDGDNDVHALFAPGHDVTLIPLLGHNRSMVTITEEGPIATDSDGTTILWHDGDYGVPLASAIASEWFARLTRNGAIVWGN